MDSNDIFKLEFVARHKGAYALAETDIWKFKKSVKSAKKSEKAGAVMGPGLRWRLHVSVALTAPVCGAKLFATG